MKNDDETRRDLLNNLISGSFDLNELQAKLNTYDWDYNGQAVTLNTTDIIAILNRFLSAELSSSYIQQWAETLEVREDIDYPLADDELISQVIFDLATPELQGALNKDTAAILMHKMQKPSK